MRKRKLMFVLAAAVIVCTGLWLKFRPVIFNDFFSDPEVLTGSYGIDLDDEMISGEDMRYIDVAFVQQDGKDFQDMG